MTKFSCFQCGLCCQHLELNTAYSDLDRGDGVCKYYVTKEKQCCIYEDRPALCRVDESFSMFSKKMSRDEYYAANLRACHELNDQFGNGQKVIVLTNEK